MIKANHHQMINQILTEVTQIQILSKILLSYPNFKTIFFPLSSSLQVTTNLMIYIIRYNNILIPSVFTMDLIKVDSPPWRDSTAKQSDYFNYGFNEETWKKYASMIQGKFDGLCDLISQQKYIIPKLKDEFNYLLNFPSDYGGLGDVLNDQKFGNVNFFETKVNSHQLSPLIRIDHDQLYVPLEISTQSLNSNNGNIPNNSAPLINNFNSVPYNSFPVMPIFNPELYNFMCQQNMLLQKEEMNKKQEIEYYNFIEVFRAEKKSKVEEKKKNSKSSHDDSKSDSDNSDNSESDSDSDSSESDSDRRKRKKRNHKSKHSSHRSRSKSKSKSQSRSKDYSDNYRRKTRKRSPGSNSRDRNRIERSRSKDRRRKRNKFEEEKYQQSSKRDKHRSRK